MVGRGMVDYILSTSMILYAGASVPGINFVVLAPRVDVAPGFRYFRRRLKPQRKRGTIASLPATDARQ